MIKNIFLSAILGLIVCYAGSSQTEVSTKTGTVCFLRSTGFQASAIAFKTFIDASFICKLNNKKYSMHEVPEGVHQCSVQFFGKNNKKKTAQFEIVVEAGKINYVQLAMKKGFWKSSVYCEELTPNTAIAKMKELKEDTKCI